MPHLEPPETPPAAEPRPTTPADAAVRERTRSVWAFYRMHAMGAIFPVLAALMLYGWRAIGAIAVVITAAAAGFRIWQRVGRRGSSIRPAQGLWVALLLALMLPAHLLTDTLPTGGPMPWAVLVAAGLLLAAVTWIIGQSSVRAGLVTYLILVAIFGGLFGSGEGLLTPHWVLYRDRVLTGELAATQRTEFVPATQEGWLQLQSTRETDSMLVRHPAASQMTWSPWTRRPIVSIDDLPPLEDLIIGGHPGPMGAGSAIAVIIGGLFLLYRGLIDYRIPLLMYLAAMAGLLLLPLPYALAEGGAPWESLLASSPGAGLSVAVTFANYQTMAGPMLFAIFFLATAPAARPIARRGRFIYAILGGAGIAAAQLYLSVAHGPYIAVLLTMLLTPALNRLFPARVLV